ncbi:MAG: hypothetical protein QXT63_03940 [Thermoplasmata archaeon]
MIKIRGEKKTVILERCNLDKNKENLEKWKKKAIEISERITSDSPKTSEIVSSFLILISIRNDYISEISRTCPLSDFQGIMYVDSLDDMLLIHTYEFLQKSFSKCIIKKSEETKQTLKTFLSSISKITTLPKSPPPYLVFNHISELYSIFSNSKKNHDDKNKEDLEYAFLVFLLNVLQQYFSTRIEPSKKHLSDVTREYYVVSRMKCNCGICGYSVVNQRVVVGKNPADILSVKCESCGLERTLEFPLHDFF